MGVTVDTAISELAQLNTSAASLRAFREGTLDILARAVAFDRALVHALSPRVPLETAVLRGFTLDAIARSVPKWDDLAVELGAFRDFALAHGGVATDSDAAPPRSKGRRSFETHVGEPLGLRACAIVHFIVRGQVRGAALLGRAAAAPFSAADRSTLVACAPLIAAGDALHCALDDAATAAVPVRLRCVDTRLTERQREIVEHVALGHTNAAIAIALGLSPNTLRNHLARVFARLGASNRADLVRLAVLRSG